MTEETVATIPLFQGLDAAQHAAVAAIASEKTAVRGQIVFAEGAQAEGIHILTEGRVKVYKLSPEGKEQILHVFGPGEPVGEVAVFAGRKYPAYAEALEPSRFLYIPRREFMALLQREPAVALNMLAELAHRLRRFTNMVENLSLREVPGRLAAYLMYLNERQDARAEIQLDMTKAQLASLLGTIPETLSRILARMAKEGFIELGEGRAIKLLDPEGLQQLASGESKLA